MTCVGCLVHISTELASLLVLILFRFALLKLSPERCMVLISQKCSIIVVKVLNTLSRQSFSSGLIAKIK